MSKYRERLLCAAHAMTETQAYPDGPYNDLPFLEEVDAVLSEHFEATKSEAVSLVEHYDSYIASRLKEQLK